MPRALIFYYVMCFFSFLPLWRVYFFQGSYNFYIEAHFNCNGILLFRKTLFFLFFKKKEYLKKTHYKSRNNLDPLKNSLIACLRTLEREEGESLISVIVIIFYCFALVKIWDSISLYKVYIFFQFVKKYISVVPRTIGFLDLGLFMFLWIFSREPFL